LSACGGWRAEKRILKGESDLDAFAPGAFLSEACFESVKNIAVRASETKY